MRYVQTWFAIVACLVFGSLHVEGQVPSDVERRGYDIGLTTPTPTDKADTVVVFSATWCGPCQVMKPIWKSLKKDGYRIVYIELDTNEIHYAEEDEYTAEELATWRKLDHRSVPTCYLWNSTTEKVIRKHVGLRTKGTIEKDLWKQSS